VCEQKELVYEEAPASHRDIDRVVQCLTDINVFNSSSGTNEEDGVDDAAGGGLVRILATLRPILTYKHKYPYGPK
jgi:hypothetical protein